MKIKRVLSLLTKQNNMGKVARNTLYLTISEFVLKIVGVLWIVFLARSFSVPTYGEYNFIIAYIAIFSFLPDFGVGLIVIREIARDPKHAPEYIGNSFILNGILALVTFIVIAASGVVFGVPVQIYPLLVISAITLVLSTFRSVAIFYFDGTEKMQYSAVLNTLNTILLVICAVAGVALGFGLYGIFIGMLVGTVISLGISWATALGFVKPEFVYDRKTVIYYLKQGVPLGLAAFAALVYSHIDVLIMAKLIGNRAVGIYSAATPFTFGLIQLLNVPFIVAVFPALSRLHNEDTVRFKKGLIRGILFIILWSVPSAIVVSLGAGITIPLVFGTKYNLAIPFLRILIFSVPFMALSALLYKVLIVYKKQIWYLYVSIAAALINAFLNILLIQQFQIYGAVYAFIITQVVLLIVYSILVYILIRKHE